MEQIRITPYTLIWVWAVAGFLLGLIPLILGIVRKKTSLGISGLISSTIGGALAGIFLIVPILVGFIWLIVKKNNPIEVDSADENPIDVEDDNSENR